jgi:hypothetical protein
MDTGTLARIMSEHEIRHRDLALIAKVTLRTVSMWKNGYAPVPRAVALILHAVDEGVLTENWLADHIRAMELAPRGEPLGSLVGGF